MNEPLMDQILQTGLGFWASKTLLSAVELELFTELAKDPGTLTEVRDRLRLHPRSAHDFLDALVALNFLERRDGTYYNTPQLTSTSTNASPRTSAAYSRWPTTVSTNSGAGSQQPCAPASRKAKS